LAAAFRRLSLCLLKTSSIGGIVVISDPKAPGIIKFSQADEVLRRDTEYHTCPLGADVAAAARISFPAHPHSVVAAHWPIAAERDNNTDLGP
jgi:hypothetical protein